MVTDILKYIFFCNSESYVYFIEYYQSLIKYFTNYELCLFNNYNNNENNVIGECFRKEFYNKTVFIFLLYIPECVKIRLCRSMDNRIFLLNTEQLNRLEQYNRISPELSRYSVLDYSQVNLKILNSPERTFLLPYCINRDEIYNYDKIYDVAQCGVADVYRQYIIDQVQNRNIKITNVIGWGQSRDDVLFRSKILLNIHFNETYKVFEEIRCNRCIFNKMIVISEESLMPDDYILKDFVILCKYEELVDKVEYVLTHYEEIYHQLYSNFDEKLNDIKAKYDIHFAKFARYCESLF